jgi:4-hydroxy-tetrahydrodipicolinate reductase
MLVAILGEGRLGSVIAQAAKAQGIDHIIVSGQDLREARPPDGLTTRAKQHRRLVLLDSTVGEAVKGHLLWALALERSIVIGATGHGLTRSDLEAHIKRRIGVLLAPNFAPGALMMGRIAEALGAWCRDSRVTPFLEERHHSRKKDAPSGTAMWLTERMSSTGGPKMSMTSTRAGLLTGSHLIGLDAPGELTELRHTVLARDAYGTGAIAACRFIAGKKGVFGLEDWAKEMYPWP